MNFILNFILNIYFINMSWTGIEPATFDMTNQHSTTELPTLFYYIKNNFFNLFS